MVRLRVDNPYAGGGNGHVVDVGPRPAAIGPSLGAVMKGNYVFTRELIQFRCDRSFTSRPLRPDTRADGVVAQSQQQPAQLRVR